jgi:hypothetical protein
LVKDGGSGDGLAIEEKVGKAVVVADLESGAGVEEVGH